MNRLPPTTPWHKEEIHFHQCSHSRYVYSFIVGMVVITLLPMKIHAWLFVVCLANARYLEKQKMMLNNQAVHLWKRVKRREFLLCMKSNANFTSRWVCNNALKLSFNMYGWSVYLLKFEFLFTCRSHKILHYLVCLIFCKFW